MLFSRFRSIHVVIFFRHVFQRSLCAIFVGVIVILNIFNLVCTSLCLLCYEVGTIVMLCLCLFLRYPTTTFIHELWCDEIKSRKIWGIHCDTMYIAWYAVLSKIGLGRMKKLSAMTECYIHPIDNSICLTNDCHSKSLWFVNISVELTTLTVQGHIQ